MRTVAIGDLRYIRKDIVKKDKLAKELGKKPRSKVSSQKIHQMPTDRVRQMLTYKAKRLGINVILVNEAFTSQTCPSCGTRNKTNNREYFCVLCGFSYHRDGVGAINIQRIAKYQELKKAPVVGVMTSPIGLRYKSHSLCTSKAV